VGSARGLEEVVTDHRTHHFSDGVARVAVRLVVHRHHAERRMPWVLSWDFGDGTSVGAEGECSRVFHRTARAAKAYAERRYGERAVTARGW